MQNMTDRNTGEDRLKIGVFGGAFNPVHNGHIRLAKGYFDSLKLDKLLFVPTANPPHKTSDGLVNGADRINMLSLAIKDIDGFEISDIEFSLEGKSYTYNTLLEIKKRYGECELFLIIGADQLFYFDKWYRYKEILDMVTLCTAARDSGSQRDEMTEYAKSLKGLDMKRFYLSEQDVYKISSSEIREALKKGEDVSAHLPDDVYEYIKEKRLYLD